MQKEEEVAAPLRPHALQLPIQLTPTSLRQHHHPSLQAAMEKEEAAARLRAEATDLERQAAAEEEDARRKQAEAEREMEVGGWVGGDGVPQACRGRARDGGGVVK